MGIRRSLFLDTTGESVEDTMSNDKTRIKITFQANGQEHAVEDLGALRAGEAPAAPDPLPPRENPHVVPVVLLALSRPNRNHFGLG